MEDYNKIKQLKSEMGGLVMNWERMIRDCVNKNQNNNNLNERINSIDSCVNGPQITKLKEQISQFKSTYNLTEKDNWIAIGQLDNLEKNFEQNQIKKDFPLSENEKWKKSFDWEFKITNNYLKSYFRANSSILYGESPFVKNSCMNHKTIDGTGFIADDLINCINKAKKLNENK